MVDLSALSPETAASIWPSSALRSAELRWGDDSSARLADPRAPTRRSTAASQALTPEAPVTSPSVAWLAARPASTLLRRLSRLSTVCCASVRRSFEAATAAVPVGSGTGGEGDGGDGDGVTDAVAAAVDVGVAVADTVGSGD